MQARNKSPIHYLSVLTLAFLVVFAYFAIQQRNVSADDSQDLRVSAVCLDCHDGVDTKLALTPHHLNSETLDGAEARVTCTDCHIGDARHYEDDPEVYPMGNPAKAGAVSAAAICSSCHLNAHQQNMLESNVHAENDVNCAGCHSVHASSLPGLLKKAESSLCIDCHSGVEADFAQPFRHPVSEGIVVCSECHMTLDETRKELSLNGTNMCVRCHNEFEGPFPYEHQATLDYSTEEGGCLNCHDPHGSAQPRMLKQPFEAPHWQLCTQCHGVPARHNQNAQHGDLWAGISCNECHTDIHGSYTNRFFLSESLEGQGCLNSGCHGRAVSK